MNQLKPLLISILIFLTSCDKVIDVSLPNYEPQLVIEMYLENGKPLRCLVTESIPYTDTAINRPVNDAVVTVTDGTNTYILNNGIFRDDETGRFFNYENDNILIADPSTTYELRVEDPEQRVATAKTNFLSELVLIDSVVSRISETRTDSFSVGVVFQDPVESRNYYRFLVGKDFSNLDLDPTDFSLNDISFNGNRFSFYSEADYERNDTVTVRVYSLLKEHYEYRESARDARGAIFNPFAQPGKIRSNINGGLGVFTTIQYDEKKLIVKE